VAPRLIGARPFRVRYEVEMVVEAKHVRDALRQATKRGATEVMAIMRID
jgi:hypothetical protein